MFCIVSAQTSPSYLTPCWLVHNVFFRVKGEGFKASRYMEEGVRGKEYICVWRAICTLKLAPITPVSLA